MITKTTRTPVRASASVTSNAQRRRPAPSSKVMASMAALTPAQQAFAVQLKANMKRHASVTAATNTANIMAKPEFMELLPLFVQKLLVLDVFGSVAMKSRQQLIPYFKVVAENTKGETGAGTVLSSPFVNRQGVDHNFTGRVVKNEELGAAKEGVLNVAYTPILPGSVTLYAVSGGVATPYADDATGSIKDGEGAEVATIDYANGIIETADAASTFKITYQYDNETVGPDANGNYGAKMAKVYLQLDEINLVAEAHEIACYYSIFAAFAANTEYGANIGEMAKEAAIGELTAEINSSCFDQLRRAAKYKSQFNWDASPVLSGAVVPSDYLKMFKLKLGQAAASIYQVTRLTQPNRLVVGTNVAEYLKMVEGFKAAPTGENVGPYKLGTLDQFECFVDPNYDPNLWVMSCKSNDIRRNSALFGEYMPMMDTGNVTLANGTVQNGHATMYASEVVNPDTVVSGKILGLF